MVVVASVVVLCLTVVDLAAVSGALGEALLVEENSLSLSHCSRRRQQDLASYLGV